MKSSSERKTALPFFTSTGPPPSAERTPSHVGCKISRVVSGVPTGASACSFAAVVPVAIRIAPSGGIDSPPPLPTAVTVAVRSVFGTADGNGCRITSAEPATRGRAEP